MRFDGKLHSGVHELTVAWQANGVIEPFFPVSSLRNILPIGTMAYSSADMSSNGLERSMKRRADEDVKRHPKSRTRVVWLFDRPQ